MFHVSFNNFKHFEIRLWDKITEILSFYPL